MPCFQGFPVSKCTKFFIQTHSLSTKAENIVKECAGITAVCHANSNDTKILNSIGETILSGINLWDLHEMIKEVF